MSFTFFSGGLSNPFGAPPPPRSQAYITTAAFGTLTTVGQIPLTGIAGTFSYYNILVNGVTVASSQTASTYTYTSLTNNTQYGPFTVVPYNAAGVAGTAFTVTGGVTGNGRIYTWANAGTLNFSNTTATQTTLAFSGQAFSSVYISYTPTGSVSPASGTNTTATSGIAFSAMTAGTSYTFTAYPVNGDNVPGSASGSNYSTATMTTASAQPVVTGGTLIALYGFNNSVTTVPSTSNGTAPSFTNGTATISTSTYKIGPGSLSFSNAAYNMLSLGKYTVTNNNQISLAFWYYPVRTTLTGNVGAFLLNSANSFSGNPYYTLNQNYNSGTTNNVRFQPFGAGSAGPNIYITGDTWTHIVLTYNGQTCTTYFNGSLIQTVKFANSVTTSTVFYLWLGGNSSSGTGQRGSMFFDEFRIYDGVLNATDVTNIYNWGQSG